MYKTVIKKMELMSRQALRYITLFQFFKYLKPLIEQVTFAYQCCA